jgi:ubiquinone biosynthesis protein
MTIRIVEVIWQVFCAVILLVFRLSWNRLARGHRTVSSCVGQTLTGFLERLGPAYIKLGQILSTRQDLLNEDVICELKRLQDALPPIPFCLVVRTLTLELGASRREAFSEFDPTPIASGSIASVYRGRLRDGRSVAVKVLRPNISRVIRRDQRILYRMAHAAVKFRCFRHIPILPAVQEFNACLERQLNFRREAAANRIFHSALALEPRIVIPTLVEELCTASIITMEFIEEFHDFSLKETAQLHEATRALLRALYRMIFVVGVIHCDLHRGNVRFVSGGRAAIVDFGFVAELSVSDRLKFAQFFFAIATNDGARCAKITLETALIRPRALNWKLFETEVADLVQRVSGVEVRDFYVSDFVSELFRIQRNHGIIGTSAFTMAILSLLVFEGIAKTAFPELDFQREALPFLFQAANYTTLSSRSQYPPDQLRLSPREDATTRTPISPSCGRSV